MPVSSLEVGDSVPVTAKYASGLWVEFDLDGISWNSREPIPVALSGEGELQGVATLTDHWDTDFEGTVSVDFGGGLVVHFAGGPLTCA